MLFRSIVGYSENRYPQHQVPDSSFFSFPKKDINRLFRDLSDRNKWIAQGVLLGLLASQREEVTPEDGEGRYGPSE